jgi:hypothetical protein
MYDIKGRLPMKRTVYLSEDLETRVSDYLQQNPQLTFSSLVQDALETALAPKDLSHLLNLAGVVTTVETPAAAKAEDQLVFEERP